MTPTTLYYERIFPIAQYINEKIGIEATIDPGETYEEALVKAHQPVMQASEKINPFANLDTGFGPGIQPSSRPIMAAPIPEIPVEKPIPEVDMIKGYIEAIQKCTTIPKPDGIDSDYSLAQQYPEVKVAYDIKKAELVKKETAEILAATEANCLKPKKLSK